MRRTQVLWEVYVRRFEDAFDRYKKGRLTADEAGELLNLSGRHFRRRCARFEAEGIEGLRDKRLGRVSGHRVAEDELDRMRRLYREEYSDFLVTHFHEELRHRHDYKLGYTVTRLALQSAGLVKPADHRGKHRRIFLIGGLAIPLCRAGIVRCHTLAFVVNETEVVLGGGVALTGGLWPCSTLIATETGVEQGLSLCLIMQLCRRADALNCRRCLWVAFWTISSAVFG